jgi:aryl-phospho-beta-D-glucosidase BglC (GH1 family)
MFSKSREDEPQPPNLRELDLVAELGLDFVRVPADYRFWVSNFDYLHPNHKVLHVVDRYLEACRERKLHLCFNLHRAPGYCINRGEAERDNLWTDRVAQDGFVFQWETLARIYKGVPGKDLSFDLVNEPPNLGVRGFSRSVHATLIRRTAKAIRSVDPERAIVIDGIAGGNLAVPELAGLGAVHSGRGYQPYCLTHYKAPWSKSNMEVPLPVWPDLTYKGATWNREALKKFYQPWRDVESQGVRVHIGEFGCYKETPNTVALRWFEDLLGLFKEFRWGYALWNFKGPFGVIEHDRPGTEYENWRGYKLDRRMIEIFLANRVGEGGGKARDPRKESAVIKRAETRLFEFDQ